MAYGRIKSVLLALFLFTGIARATTTVSGTLLTPAEVAVASNAYARLELKNYGNNLPRVLGTNTILPSFVDIYPDATGAITTDLTGNELINPGNTWYRVTYFRGGTRFYICDIVVPSTLAGTVDTSGTSVTWVSGNKFPYYLAVDGIYYSFDWVGSVITINSVDYTIVSVDSETTLTVSVSAGIQSGVVFSHGANTLNLDSAPCRNETLPSAFALTQCTTCPAGAQGPAGADGIDGATGATGATGAQGPPGTCPSCDLDEVFPLLPPTCHSPGVTLRTFLYPRTVSVVPGNVGVAAGYADPTGLSPGSGINTRWHCSALSTEPYMTWSNFTAVPGSIDTAKICDVQLIQFVDCHFKTDMTIGACYGSTWSIPFNQFTGPAYDFMRMVTNGNVTPTGFSSTGVTMTNNIPCTAQIDPFSDADTGTANVSKIAIVVDYYE